MSSSTLKPPLRRNEKPPAGAGEEGRKMRDIDFWLGYVPGVLVGILILWRLGLFG